MAIVLGFAKGKSRLPRAGSKLQSITNGGASWRMPAARARLEICRRVLTMMMYQTFLTPFGFILVSHKKLHRAAQYQAT
jgi:hypothetical protein